MLRIVNSDNLSRPSSTGDLVRRWSANTSSNRASFATKNKQSYTFGKFTLLKFNEQIQLIGGKTNIAKILMANELATANETGTHPSVIEKNINGSISNKHVLAGAAFGPNHFQSSFSL